jgi:hypothetical protein
MNRAPYTASGEPWTINRNLSVFNAASYLMTLSFGMPILTRACSESADPADNNRSLKACDNPANQWTSNENWSNARYRKQRGSKQKSPEPAPECSDLAPVLHPVASVVIANDMFIGVRASARNREALHIDPCLLERPDGAFRLLVRVVYGDN